MECCEADRNMAGDVGNRSGILKSIESEQQQKCDEERTSAEIEQMKSLLKDVTVSRLTLPDDANIYGNVHGGTILKFIEEAGAIISTRYCNNAANSSDSSEPCVTTLVRIEHMDFLQPMMIGEVAVVTAEIIFTSEHSLLVEVTVHAENIIKGVKRNTNRAYLWYVPIGFSENVLSVPPMTYDSLDAQVKGQRMYEKQKSERQSNVLPRDNLLLYSSCLPEPEPHTVAYSQSTLSILVGPSEVTLSRHCRGSVLLKLMDECAGIVAAKHCRNNVVTACLDATNFYKMIKLGSLITVVGRVIFTSNKSLEIEVIVEFDSPLDKQQKRERTVDAFFTYVSIDNKGKAIPVPPLKIKTDEETARYQQGQERYQKRKEQHQRNK